MATDNLRREFLKKAALIAGAMVIAPSFVVSASHPVNTIGNGSKTTSPCLNQDIRMKCYMDGRIELSSKQNPTQKFVYSGFEAGILLSIASYRPIHAQLKEVTSHNSISYSAGKEKILPLLNEFEEKGFITYPS